MVPMLMLFGHFQIVVSTEFRIRLAQVAFWTMSGVRTHIVSVGVWRSRLVRQRRE